MEKEKGTGILFSNSKFESLKKVIAQARVHS
jgi:hypothetical protein